MIVGYGFEAGPADKTILLGARIDGMVTTELDERALVHRLLKKAVQQGHSE